MKPNDMQIGGNHYKKLEYEHWDFVTDVTFSDSYLKGCCSKYIVRWRDKNGIEDLQKALHYLDKIISLNINTVMVNDTALQIFVRQLNEPERQIIIDLYMLNYQSARQALEKLISEVSRNG